MIRMPANEGGGFTATFVADSTGGACVAAPEGLLRRPGICVGQQDPAPERDPLRIPLARVGRRNGDLDVLGRALAQEQVVLAAGELDDVLVHLVAADADRAAHDDAAE